MKSILGALILLIAIACIPAEGLGDPGSTKEGIPPEALECKVTVKTVYEPQGVEGSVVGYEKTPGRYAFYYLFHIQGEDVKIWANEILDIDVGECR